ncbi:hypothetical protein JP75_03900 [Devosia riboflavina]|uniref:DUF3298 domain-containing protein n=1 Tax=Devosia riboflavina TaxID=46914 RepID=A0A087M5H0_9HYPH|nr:hypothetical protein [Devosia riboflavina]KFL32123.1 hypothetical protein JP75_03900 [Devosia riboflavina]
MRHAAILLALFAATPALGDEVRTFMGTLNGREILVELTDAKSGPVVGRYTYKDTGGDVPLLAVSQEGNAFTLHEEAPCDETTCRTDDAGNAVDPPLAAVWTLTYDPEEYIATGTRAALDGKAKTVDLTLEVLAWRDLDPSEVPTPFGLHDRSAALGFQDGAGLNWSAAPYEMSLLETAFEEGPEQTLGGASFRDVVDPRTKFAFPRVTGFADGSPVDKVNAILAERHGRMTLAAFDCLAFRYASYGKGEYMTGTGGTLGDYDGELVTLSYASPRLVSWVQSGSLWCTGAHPYNHIDSYNFDVETGKPIDLKTVFSAFVPRQWGGAVDEVADAEAVAANPDAFFWGPNADLVAYVRDNVPADLFDEGLAEECLTDQAIVDQLDIRFEAGDAVMFTLSGFPHAISVCNGDLFSVRIEALKPFLAKGMAEYFPGVL